MFGFGFLAGVAAVVGFANVVVRYRNWRDKKETDQEINEIGTE